MAGPGEFVSTVNKEGQPVWKPKMNKLFWPNEDSKRSSAEPKPLLDPSGKQMETLNPAAVESIAKYVGEGKTEMPVILYPETKEAKENEELKELRAEMAELKKMLKK